MGMDWLVGAAFTVILDNLWIAAAIAAIAWALGRYLPRTNAATRHLLWWTVLACVLLVPLVSLTRPAESDSAIPAVVAPAETTADVAVSAPQAAAPSPAATFPLQIPEGAWARAAFVLWFGFAFVQAIRMVWSFLYLFRMKRKSRPASPDLAARFRYWIIACRVHRSVRLLVSDRITSPMATGYFRPAVILPAALLSQFGESELDHVLLHELAHVARRDDWTNLFARAMGALVGLHPVAAWTLRQIAHERELACDDWVVSRTGEARTYAASLARLFEVCRAQRRVVLATGMAGSTSSLGQRIETLLESGRHFSTRASLLRVAFASLALLALVGAAGVAPSWIVMAQSQAPAQSGNGEPRPVNPHGSFLAALVAAGYGNLSVDEIIALKEHGVDSKFLAEFSQSGWEKLPARDMISLHDHGVPPEMLRSLHDAGYQHIEARSVIEAWEQGVRPGTLKEASQYGTHLTLAQVVKLRQAGVIQ